MPNASPVLPPAQFIAHVAAFARGSDDVRERSWVHGGKMVDAATKAIVAVEVSGPDPVEPASWDARANSGFLTRAWTPSGAYGVVDAFGIMLLDRVRNPRDVLKGEVLGVLEGGPGRWLAFLSTKRRATAIAGVALAEPGAYALPAHREAWSVDPAVAVVDAPALQQAMIDRFGPRTARPDTLAYCVARAAIEGGVA